VKTGPRTDRVLVEHMISCIEAIDEFLGGDPERFQQSRLVRDAVLRNLQTMTESSQRLSDALKASHPDVPWRALAGFRNLLVHDYLGGIDAEAVMNILRRELGPLKSTLGVVRADLESP
jgi:uncharacterized protein with HEPN domain